MNYVIFMLFNGIYIKSSVFMNNSVNLSYVVRNLLLEKKKNLLKEVNGNLLTVFRDNYLDFEELVNFYKKFPSYGLRNNENAYMEIRKILIDNGVVSQDKLSEQMVRSYMSRVRKERKKEE